MGNISGLPDELLVRILSFVPTKVAVSTSILSSRWKFLWMWLSKLEYTCGDRSLPVLRDFISKSLPLHRAPVIESLHLDLLVLRDLHIKPQDINLWVDIAVSRHIRELDISLASYSNENMFPNSLFTCKSLVVLKLRYSVMDVPSMVCLPSLKTLQLERVKYADEESLQALLSICPVLEDLEVLFREYENMIEFTVAVPSLQKLSLNVSYGWDLLERYEIDTPSLEYLKLADWTGSPSPCSFKSMPKLKEAHLVVDPFPLKSVIGSATSVKHLTVCSTDVYGDGIVFDKLEHLKLCVCTEDSSNVLANFLKDSPNLRVLKIFVLDPHGATRMVRWNQPSCVPECMLSSLQILNWSPYSGSPQEREIAVYILKNARHLRRATFWPDKNKHDVPIIKMIKELTLSSRASSTCELVFF